MSEISITKQRLKELERVEAKMQALEAGGVDNWEWYGESLSEYNKENEKEELIDDLIGELSEVFGECAYEPSERGAGIAFNDEVHDSVKETLSRAGITFKSLLDEEAK